MRTYRTKWGRIDWFGQELLRSVHVTLESRLAGAGEIVAGVQRTLVGASPPPSSPGQPPRKDTGELQDSIDYRVMRRPLAVRVGTSLDYGVYLEYGTRPHWIFPVRASMLSWIDRTTGERRFAHAVHHPGFAPRPWLLPSLVQSWNRVRRFVLRPMNLGAVP